MSGVKGQGKGNRWSEARRAAHMQGHVVTEEERLRRSEGQIQRRNRDGRKSKEHRSAYLRRGNLQKNYGITPEQYDEMVRLQGSICPVCRRPLDLNAKKKPPVDHCHKTGKIRGVIHHACNLGIGFLNDDPVLLRLAAEYLEKQ